MNSSYGPFVSRKLALEKGLKFYCGAPCTKGHTGPRYVCNKRCLECIDLSRDKNRARQRAWAKSNPEKVLRSAERYRANESPEQLENRRRLKRESARRNGATGQAWRKKNPEKVKAYLKKDRDKRCSVTHALKQRLLQAVRAQKSYKHSKTSGLIGCSYFDLRSHLEAQFLPGMTWKNHGRHGWHIDHIRPCASFDLTDPEQQKQCFHYSNLQPLWAADNIRKSDNWLPDADGRAACCPAA